MDQVKEIELLRADIEALKLQQSKLMQVDGDLREVLINYLLGTIQISTINQPERLNGLKKFVYELTNTFNPELVYYLLQTASGVPLEVVYHNMAMQSDIPVRNYTI
jgi:hypothetical protein